ncbi:unnamed protein product [Notodromas monacha]|uniref:Uncharacterized protein n=1 Tax=Notodromas monacha TaxID=399045 RepID=A0A7R9BPA2_9CRUS|nr:unnamed protein product [Notodromas monacha]CAG0917681.1 unnamed protein product [Notodromas monacha]
MRNRFEGLQFPSNVNHFAVSAVAFPPLPNGNQQAEEWSYIFYLPIVAAGWIRLNVSFLAILVGPRIEWEQNPRTSVMIQALKNLGPNCVIYYLYDAEGEQTNDTGVTMSQISRLFGALILKRLAAVTEDSGLSAPGNATGSSTRKNIDSILVTTTDADLMPVDGPGVLRRPLPDVAAIRIVEPAGCCGYFLHVFRQVWMHPMSYVTMNVSQWQTVIGYSGNEVTPKRIREAVDKELGLNLLSKIVIRGGPGWYLDQHFLSVKIDIYLNGSTTPGQNSQRLQLVSRNMLSTDRIDRSGWVWPRVHQQNVQLQNAKVGHKHGCTACCSRRNFCTQNQQATRSTPNIHLNSQNSSEICRLQKTVVVVSASVTRLHPKHEPKFEFLKRKVSHFRRSHSSSKSGSSFEKTLNVSLESFDADSLDGNTDVNVADTETTPVKSSPCSSSCCKIQNCENNKARGTPRVVVSHDDLEESLMNTTTTTTTRGVTLETPEGRKHMFASSGRRQRSTTDSRCSSVSGEGINHQSNNQQFGDLISDCEKSLEFSKEALPPNNALLLESEPNKLLLDAENVCETILTDPKCLRTETPSHFEHQRNEPVGKENQSVEKDLSLGNLKTMSANGFMNGQLDSGEFSADDEPEEAVFEHHHEADRLVEEVTISNPCIPFDSLENNQSEVSVGKEEDLGSFPEPQLVVSGLPSASADMQVADIWTMSERRSPAIGLISNEETEDEVLVIVSIDEENDRIGVPECILQDTEMSAEDSVCGIFCLFNKVHDQVSQQISCLEEIELISRESGDLPAVEKPPSAEPSEKCSNLDKACSDSADSSLDVQQDSEAIQFSSNESERPEEQEEMKSESIPEELEVSQEDSSITDSLPSAPLIIDSYQEIDSNSGQYLPIFPINETEIDALPKDPPNFETEFFDISSAPIEPAEEEEKLTTREPLSYVEQKYTTVGAANSEDERTSSAEINEEFTDLIALARHILRDDDFLSLETIPELSKEDCLSENINESLQSSWNALHPSIRNVWNDPEETTETSSDQLLADAGNTDGKNSEVHEVIQGDIWPVIEPRRFDDEVSPLIPGQIADPENSISSAPNSPRKFVSGSISKRPSSCPSSSCWNENFESQRTAKFSSLQNLPISEEIFGNLSSSLAALLLQERKMYSPEQSLISPDDSLGTRSSSAVDMGSSSLDRELGTTSSQSSILASLIESELREALRETEENALQHQRRHQNLHKKSVSWTNIHLSPTKNKPITSSFERQQNEGHAMPTESDRFNLMHLKFERQSPYDPSETLSSGTSRVPHQHYASFSNIDQELRQQDEALLQRKLLLRQRLYSTNSTKHSEEMYAKSIRESKETLLLGDTKIGRNVKNHAHQSLPSTPRKSAKVFNDDWLRVRKDDDYDTENEHVLDHRIDNFNDFGNYRRNPSHCVRCSGYTDKISINNYFEKISFKAIMEHEEDAESLADGYEGEEEEDEEAVLKTQPVQDPQELLRQHISGLLQTVIKSLFDTANNPQQLEHDPNLSTESLDTLDKYFMRQETMRVGDILVTTLVQAMKKKLTSIALSPDSFDYHSVSRKQVAQYLAVLRAIFLSFVESTESILPGEKAPGTKEERLKKISGRYRRHLQMMEQVENYVKLIARLQVHAEQVDAENKLPESPSFPPIEEISAGQFDNEKLTHELDLLDHWVRSAEQKWKIYSQATLETRSANVQDVVDEWLRHLSELSTLADALRKESFSCESVLPGEKAPGTKEERLKKISGRYRRHLQMMEQVENYVKLIARLQVHAEQVDAENKLPESPSFPPIEEISAGQFDNEKLTHELDLLDHWVRSAEQKWKIYSQATLETRSANVQDVVDEWLRHLSELSTLADALRKESFSCGENLLRISNPSAPEQRNIESPNEEQGNELPEAKENIIILPETLMDLDEDTKQRIAALLDHLKYLDQEVNQDARRTEETLQVMAPLESYFKDLCGTRSWKGMEETIQSLFTGFLILWDLSKFYGNDENILGLLKQVVAAIATRISKELSLKKLFNQSSAEIKTTLQSVIDLMNVWRNTYLDVRDTMTDTGDITTETVENAFQRGTRRWEFDRRQIFEKMECIAKICEDLLCVVKVQEEFYTVLGRDLSVAVNTPHRVTSLRKRVEFISAGTLSDLKFDPFLAEPQRAGMEGSNGTPHQWQSTITSFWRDIRFLESETISFLNEAFMNIRSVEAASLCLENLLTSNTRASIQGVLIQKLKDTQLNYNKEVVRVQKTFEYLKVTPPVGKNLPAVAGAIAWERHLLSRVENPLKQFRPERMREFEQEWQETIQLSKKARNTLTTYENEMISSWRASATEKSVSKSLLPILEYNPSGTTVGNKVASKFRICRQTYFSHLIRETKSLENLGFEVSPENLAISIMDVSRRKSLVILANIIENYSREKQRLHPAEEELLNFELEAMNRKISTGTLQKYNCLSLSLETFVKKISDELSKLVALIDTVQQLSKCLGNHVKAIAKMDLFEKPIDGTAVHSTEELRVKSQGIPSCKGFFEQLSRWQTEWITISLSNYKSLSPVLINVEAILCGTSTGRAKRMQKYYHYWEVQVYQALVSMNHFERWWKGTCVSCSPETVQAVALRQTQYGFLTRQTTGSEQSRDTQAIISASAASVCESASEMSLPCNSGKRHRASRRTTFYEDVCRHAGIVSAVAGVKASAKQLIHELQGTLLRWRKFRPLWILDRTKVLQKFMSSNPIVTDFENRLHMYSSVVEEASLESSHMNLHCISLDVMPMVHAVNLHGTAWMQSFALNLKSAATSKILKIKKLTKTYKALLQRSPRAFDDLKSILSTVEKILEHRLDMEREISESEEMMHTLRIYNVLELDEDDLNSHRAAKDAWNELCWAAQTLEVQLFRVKWKFKRITEIDSSLFSNQCKEFKIKFVTEGPNLIADDLDSSWSLTQAFNEDLERFQSEQERLKSAQILFNLPQGEYPDLVIVSNEMHALEAIFAIYHQYKVHVDRWSIRRCLELQSRQFSRPLKTCLHDLQPFSHSDLGSAAVAWVLEGKVRDSLLAARLLELLHSPSLRQRHYDTLNVVLGVHIEEALKTMTIGDFFGIELHQHQKVIQELVFSAEHELLIEKSIQELDEVWSNVRLTFEPYESYALSELIPILTGANQLEEVIEDSCVQLQKLNASDFAGPFVQEIASLRDKICRVEDLLLNWSETQSDLLTWEAFFYHVFPESAIDDEIVSSAKITQEADMFINAMKIYTKVTRTCESVDSSVMEFAESYQGEQALETLLEVKQEVEKLQSCEDLAIESARGIYPAAYFLSDITLIDIMSTPPSLLEKSWISLIRPHLAELRTADTDRVTDDSKRISEAISVISFDDEELKFREGIEVPQRPVGVSWMRKIEIAIAKSHRFSTKRAIFDFHFRFESRDKFKDWINCHVASVILSAVRVWWTSAVTHALMSIEQGNAAAMKLFRQDFIRDTEGMIESVSQILSENGDETEQNRDIFHKKSTAFLLFLLHARDVIDNLIVKNVTDVGDFEWLSCFRSYWCKDVDDLVLRQCNVQHQHRHEYSGMLGSEMVCLPATDRMFLAMNQASASFQTSLLTGVAYTQVGKLVHTGDMSAILRSDPAVHVKCTKVLLLHI